MKNDKVIRLDFVCHDGMHYNAMDVELETRMDGDGIKYYVICATAYAAYPGDKELQASVMGYEESVDGYGYSYASALRSLEQNTYKQLERFKNTNELDSKMFYLRVLQWIYTGE